MPFGGCLGDGDVGLADLAEPAGVEDHHALQTLDCSQHRQDLVEPTGNLVEETHLYLVQELVHLGGLFVGLLAVAGVELLSYLVVLVEEADRHVAVALNHELRLERGSPARLGLEVFDYLELLARQGLQVCLELGQRVLGCGAAGTPDHVGCPLEKSLILVGTRASGE